jgi:hypothetical protein
MSASYPASYGGSTRREVTVVCLNGTVASPIATYTGGTGGLFTLPATITIPAGFISDHSRLWVSARVKRTGANATGQLDCQIGTGGAGSDSLLGRVQLTGTDGHVGALESCAYFNTSLTSFLANGSAAPQSSTGGGTFVDRSTNVNRAASMFVTLGMSSANAADSFALLALRVTLER